MQQRNGRQPVARPFYYNLYLLPMQARGRGLTSTMTSSTVSFLRMRHETQFMRYCRTVYLLNALRRSVASLECYRSGMTCLGIVLRTLF